MIEDVYKIIDRLEDNDLIKELKNIKDKIKSDENVKKLIKEFNLAKENYEKYNLKDDFLLAKEKLLKNEILKRYIEIQNEINLLSLEINKRIKDITK